MGVVARGRIALDVFQRVESDVRTYCRSWPVVFDRARGSWLYDEDGRAYLDFFAGAGALNYGHNNPVIKRAVIDYLERDGVTHALDMHTVAKREFLETVEELVLRPRGLDYKVMFPGPGGTNAVEAALKLARKITRREPVVHFTNAFHGMTLGALSVTGNAARRASAGCALGNTEPAPYDDGEDLSLPWFDRVEELRPAAVILEVVQGEGGINVARPEWLRAVVSRCRAAGMLVIVDDVQMGCGRTGPFFAFESTGIVPDIVCLSKSIGGYGLPLALTLFHPELDVWTPGEHNGTFRGTNPSFVAATAALHAYWSTPALEGATATAGLQVHAALQALAATHPGLTPKGRGLARGLEFSSGAVAGKVCREAFELGLLIETAGPDGEVAKIMPPLTTHPTDLTLGLELLATAVHSVLM